MHESKIFHDVRKLPVSEQSRYLDDVCGDNQELRSDIEALLKVHLHHEQSTSHGLSSAEPTRVMPETIIAEKYQLRELLGEGGMGVVYLADQIKPVNRQVAIKLIRSRLATPSQIARFEQESQMLAVLDHPHIAKVLDAGVTPLQPSASQTFYFVMEYLQGSPITAYCDQAQLSIRERVELMIPVCQAIQHAHQKGVIHRDLKPSNILVSRCDGKPLPKVIDFGIAKWQDAKSAKPDMHTEAGALIGTLEYLSPEQAQLNNRDIDTRADIYSLGVVLYELLTGVRPIDRQELGKFNYQELLESLHSREIVKPSRKMEDASKSQDRAWLASEIASRRQQVQGDLDWIVLKCLERDRNRRYESAGALSRELERYLNHEPVLAGPPSWHYRFQKFYRRHRVSVIAAGLIIITLITGIVATALGWKRAVDAERLAEKRAKEITEAWNKEAQQRQEVEKQRDFANEEKRIADAVTSFLQTKLLSQGAYEYQVNSLLKQFGDYDVAVRDPHISQLLDRAADQLKPESIEKNFPGQTRVQATLLRTVGVTYLNIGKSSQSIPLLKRALTLLEKQPGPDAGSETFTKNELGMAYLYSGDYPQSARVFKEVRDETEKLFGTHHITTLAAINNQAQNEIALCNYQAALRFQDESLARCVESMEEDHIFMLVNKGNRGLILTKLGRFAEATQCLESVHRSQSRLLGEDHPKTLLTLANLGMCYRESGRYRDAIPVLEKVRIKREEHYGKSNPQTLITTRNLALSYQDASRWNDSLELLTFVAQTQQELLPADHPELLFTRNSLAKLYRDMGKLEEATSLFQSVFDASMKKLGNSHPFTLQVHNNLGDACLSARRYDEAIAVFEQVLQLKKSSLGETHPSTLITLNNLACSYQLSGQSRKALPIFLTALDNRIRVIGDKHLETLSTRADLANCYLSLGEGEKAIELYQFVHKARTEVLGKDHLRTINTLNQLGVAYWKSQRLDQSIPCFEQVVKSYQNNKKAKEVDLLMAQSNLGVNYKDAKRIKDAIPFLQEGFLASQKYPSLTFTGPALLECHIHQKDLAAQERTVTQMINNIKKRNETNAEKTKRELATLAQRLQKLGVPQLADQVSREMKSVP